MLRSVLDASVTAPCAAASQLVGDCDNSSITLTTLAIWFFPLSFLSYRTSESCRICFVTLRCTLPRMDGHSLRARKSVFKLPAARMSGGNGPGPREFVAREELTCHR